MPVTGGEEPLPQTLRSFSAIALSLVVVFAVLVPGSAGAHSPLAVDDQPPSAGKSPPGLKSKSEPPTCTTRRSDPAYGLNRPFAGGPAPSGDVCGTVHDDKLKVTDAAGDGTQIWGGPGDDFVHAQ